jgi:XrtN system VIT domain protein
VSYWIILLGNKTFGVRKSFRKENIHKTVILYVLFFISAYALNRELPVFEDSSDWLCGYLVITTLALLSFQFFDGLPRWINRIQFFVLGTSIALYIYLSLFVVNFYPIGAIGTIFFGIGAHIFVPLLLLICAGCLVKHHLYKSGVSYGWIIAGFVSILLYSIGFVVEWGNRVDNVEKMASQSVLYPDAALPVWAKVGQSVSKDWITSRILKSDLVYTTAKHKFSTWGFFPERVSWEEKRKHDPLVFLATLLKETTLTDEDRVKILQSITDGRHQANERLWSGENLTTSYIVSDIDIFPNLRLAYTEKYLDVKNSSTRTWRNQEEAIYTFQLPEGSVITSLSLWINGKEEKGILTTKQKATNAYKTIVGVEQRDPSVVHWQEGNTVTARIFPCTNKEQRKFKIGITSPLLERDGEIIYKNITFRGPDVNGAKETIRVRFIGASGAIEMPAKFKKDKKGDYVSEQEYDADFELAFKAVPLREGNKFDFDGFTYSLQPHLVSFQPFEAKRIYLDLNTSWNATEIGEAKSLLSKAEVFIYYENEFIKITEANWDVIDELKKNNFSLFPFHLLPEVAHSLVITKGNLFSPHLSDIKDSKFAEGVSTFFASGKKAFVFNLSNQSAAYICSLRELRAFHFAQGDLIQLTDWLTDKKYPQTQESDARVVLHDANIVVTKEKTTTASLSNAPDHLARLFAYNDVMRKVGGDYFKEDFINEPLVDEAASAYVVSPVSSLIVLESKKDYDRFDISDKENSLHNAAKQSSGAVPEPHEWALIALFILFVIYVRIRR